MCVIILWAIGCGIFYLSVVVCIYSPCSFFFFSFFVAEYHDFVVVVDNN